MNVERLFDEIYSYCFSNGYINQLNESLRTSETERFSLREIDQSGLDILDVIHCLVDRERTFLLLNEIEKTVKKGDRVLEAGIGTGILSFAAGELGADVCGIELNPQILSLAERVSSFLGERDWKSPENAKFILADATSYASRAQLDVIISENIYTGLFFEKQVQIMNNLVNYLKPDGKVIPSGLRSGIALVYLQKSLNPRNYELLIVNELPAGDSYKKMSTSVVYSSLSFEIQNEEFIDSRISLDVTETGIANAVLIWSEVLFYGERKIGRSDTKFLNNDILLVLPKEIHLKNGEKIEISIKYRYGCNPDSVKISF